MTCAEEFSRRRGESGDVYRIRCERFCKADEIYGCRRSDNLRVRDERAGGGIIICSWRNAGDSRLIRSRPRPFYTPSLAINMTHDVRI